MLTGNWEKVRRMTRNEIAEKLEEEILCQNLIRKFSIWKENSLGKDSLGFLTSEIFVFLVCTRNFQGPFALSFQIC